MGQHLLRRTIRQLIAEIPGGANRVPMSVGFPDPMSFLRGYKSDENSYVMYSNEAGFDAAITSAFKPKSYKIQDNASMIFQGTIPDAKGKQYIHIFALKPSARGQDVDLTAKNVEHIETVPNPKPDEDDISDDYLNFNW